MARATHPRPAALSASGGVAPIVPGDAAGLRDRVAKTERPTKITFAEMREMGVRASVQLKNIASISGFSRDWLNSEQGVAPTPPPAAFRSSNPPRVCALAGLLSTIATTIVVTQRMVFPRVLPQNISAPSP